MRIQRQSIAGGVLTIALVITGIMGVTLASYLSLVRTQNLSTMRSQAWNMALPIAEAGVEEALAHLAYVKTNSRAANGWVLDGPVVRKERWIGSNKFNASITIATNIPAVIIVEGYTMKPAGEGLIESPRIVRVIATNDALFVKGMVAKGAIDLRGNNIHTDSFDSSTALYSTGGRYDAMKRRDKGDIATNSGLINSLSVGNADIYGRASTGPGGSVSVGSNGSVGSKAWHDAGRQGIEPGSTSDDMNVEFPDVEPPFNGGGAALSSGSVSGTNYTYVLGGGKFQATSLAMSGSQQMVVTRPSVLYVTGNISITGQSRIIIQPGGSLELYVAGAEANISGNGVSNLAGPALNFAYYGLPSNTSVTMGGNASFSGTIYAPSADFHLGGGGNDVYDFVGASITGSVQMNGHFKFHYDEAVGGFGPRGNYVVTAWNEL